MTRQKPSMSIELALEIFREHWDRSNPPGVDRVATLAGMSNNSVLDMISHPNDARDEEGENRYSRLLTRLAKPGRRSHWAKLAMQIAIATGGEAVAWVPRENWGLDEDEYKSLLDKAKRRVDDARRAQTSLIDAKVINVSIFPLAPLAAKWNDPRTPEQLKRSFLAAFTELALGSTNPGILFQYELLDEWRKLTPGLPSTTKNRVNVGVFGTVAREGKDKRVVPIPGFRYRLVCLAPATARARKLRDCRDVLVPMPDVHYCVIPGFSPHKYLVSLHPGLIPPPDDKAESGNASAYDAKAAAIFFAQRCIEHEDNDEHVPVFVTDESMAEQVAHLLVSGDVNGGRLAKHGFIDLLGNLPEAPTFPVSFQIDSSEEDFEHLLRQTVIDESGKLGQLFDLGALATARLYARALAWTAHHSADRSDGLFGRAGSVSILSRLQQRLSQIAEGRGDMINTKIVPPSYARLWEFGIDLPVNFANVLLDELLCRVVPPAIYAGIHVWSQEKAKENDRILREVVCCFLPQDWMNPLVSHWIETRAVRADALRVALPASRADFLLGPSWVSDR